MAEEKLRRTLGLAEVTFFAVGSILGAGIYAVVGKVAGYGGNMIWLSFVIAGATALMSTFSYAELSSMFPRTGAAYTYAKQALDKKLALILGLIISANGVVSGAAVSIAFAGYFASLLSINLTLAAFGVIVFVLGVNTLGIRHSSVTNIILTVIEVIGLLIVIYVAVPYVGSVDYFEMPEGGLNYIFVGAALSFFAYIGFEEAVKLGEETKSPEKTIPRALFIAAAIVLFFYVVIAVSSVSVLSPDKLGASSNPLSDIVGTQWGLAGVTTISIIALFSTTNTILSNMLGSSRVLMELGEDHRWLSFFAYVSEKRKTPVTALITAAILMACFAFIGRLEQVALIANFFIFLTFLAVNSFAISLRFTHAETERPYRIPFNIGNIPIPSALGVLLTLVLLGYTVYGLFL